VSTNIQKYRDIDTGHEIHAVLGDLVYGETTYGNKRKDHPLNLIVSSTTNGHRNPNTYEMVAVQAFGLKSNASLDGLSKLRSLLS
jgi:hypothetical protein